MGYKYTLFFFAIFAIACGLRTLQIDKGYNSDEGWLLKISGNKPAKIVEMLKHGRSVYPPLSPLLLHCWRSFGSSEAWIRSYFILFGIALCVLLYKTASLYINKTFGLTVFFLSSISPLLIWSSQFIRSYIDSAFWVMLSVYFTVKIIKDGYTFGSSLGHVAASLCALYSAYVNAILLISVNIFIAAFYIKDFKFLRSWIALQLLVALCFIPGVFLILTQAKLATAIDEQWSSRGFHLAGLSVGYYARSLAATFGMDPGFLTVHPLLSRAPKPLLAGLAALSLSLISAIFVAAIKNLTRLFDKIPLRWFFPFTLITSLIIYNIFFVELLHFPVHARYFIPQHILFLCVIALALYPFIKMGRVGAGILVSVVAAFAVRIPEAVQPEFDTKKACLYLEQSVMSEECVFMVRNTNYYILQGRLPTIIIPEIFHRSKDADCYLPLDDKAKAALQQLKEKYASVWFYKLYGNDEILGANKILSDWFNDNGYTIEEVQKFRRIEVVHYKRF